MGGQDQHAAAQLGGDLLVAEHDLGEVRAGQVGEDDAVGGVLALGERAAEPARGEAQLLDGGEDPSPGWRSATGAVPRSARDTVAIETPARSATW